MNSNLFRQPNSTQLPGLSPNNLENRQTSIHDLTYMYRNLTHGMRDIVVGYNTNINNYNQNISRYLSSINEYRNDIRMMRTQLLNNSPEISPPNTPSTPIRPVRSQPRTTTRTSESLFSNIFRFPINTGTQQYDDVVVTPTQREVENAVEVFDYSENIMQSNNRCPITMEEFTVGDRVSRIRHCEHMFHEDAINNWFRLNVRCPVCRYDIREYTNNVTDTSSNVTDVSNTTIIDEPDITTQITTELTSLLTQAWREQLQTNMNDPSQNPIYSFDIPITITSPYENEYDEDDEL